VSNDRVSFLSDSSFTVKAEGSHCAIKKLEWTCRALFVSLLQCLLFFHTKTSCNYYRTSQFHDQELVELGKAVKSVKVDATLL